MRICLLDSTTKKVINVVSLNSPNDHNETPGIEVAPQHDGDIGWTWNGTGWDVPQPPQPSVEEVITLKRQIRDKWLRRHIDNINPMRWEEFTEEEKTAWREYRQALLDVPQQQGFPYDIDWPTKP